MLLEANGLSLGYFGRKVLSDISFKIDEPAIYVLLGLNGSGKTTLFRGITGVLTPMSGNVKLGGKDTFLDSEARKQVTYLGHASGILDGVKVIDSLKFYADIEDATESDIERAVKLAEAEQFLDSYYNSLSEGQKKRVSIARAFIKEKEIYLLDEPTSNLDPKAAMGIRETLLSLSKDKIVIYSSHNLYEAREIGKYVLALSDGKMKLFDRISNLKSTGYKIGIRTDKDPSSFLANPERDGEYWVVSVKDPSEVSAIVSELVKNNISITEVKELSNPLEGLFK